MRTTGILALACLCWAGAAQAQIPQRDFLFDQPNGWVAVRSGWFFAKAGSDWYDFVTEQFTLDPDQFNAADVELDVGIRLTPRVDFVGGLAYTTVSNPSEYRDWVDNERLPIVQTTNQHTMNLTGSLKLALLERGRSIGQLAFVPRRVVPYAGAGGGALWYRVRQEGDFVDFVDLSVFPATFVSDGWTPSAHVFGGVDVGVLRRVQLTLDARYRWVSQELGADWVGFEPLDLSGFTLSGGVGFVF
jgi:hypothetical protein